MQTTISTAQLWTGRVLSGLVILFMLFDSTIKFLKPQEVVQATVHDLGYAEHHIVPIGILALVSTILYAIPRTSITGAILLTGYLGGAIATHLRVDNPLFSHTLFPVYFGLILWAGLWLRNPGLRTLMPLNRKKMPESSKA